MNFNTSCITSKHGILNIWNGVWSDLLLDMIEAKIKIMFAAETLKFGLTFSVYK